MEAKKYKQQLLNTLYKTYTQCTACPLGNLGRTHVIFGEGNPDAALMFIGEGPGQQEDLKGRPFIGRSGQLLNRIFELIGIKREDTFITNVVKCRPPNNRKPSTTESNICKNILLINQIKIIRPHVICTLGAAAIQGLLEEDTIKISHLRGHKLSFKTTTIIPTYHPAYILRNPKELSNMVKDIKRATIIALEKS